MTDLRAGLSAAAERVFSDLGLPAEAGRVTASDRPDLADFQCNGALGAAKTLKRNPREIAAQAAEGLAADPAIASVEVAGPGFINIKVSDAALSGRANALAHDPRAGARATASPRRVLV